MRPGSRQRLHQGTKRLGKRLAPGKKCFRILFLVSVIIVATGAFAWIHFHSSQIGAAAAIGSTSSKQPKTPEELLALSPAELEHYDIARMNLLCAEGLPGAEGLNLDEDLAVLDLWAQHIKSEIDRNVHDYREDPTYFYNSTNFYKMAMMARVLYEDYNIRYNPKWITSPGSERPDDHFFPIPAMFLSLD